MRAIRHDVKPNDHVEVFMFDYSTMSDQDLGDLLTYLKQLPPIDTNYPETQYGPVVPVVSNIGLFAPAAGRIDHNAPRPADPTPGATIEYGRYLSAICLQCHSPKLASKVENWNQKDFYRALRTGVLPSGRQLSPEMSPKFFGEMNDAELSALWLYLQSLSH